MDSIKSIFLIAHIRLSNRRIYKFKVRTLILVVFIVLLISFILGLYGKNDILGIIQSLVYLLIVMFLLFFWIISWNEASALLKKAEKLESLHKKYV